MASGWKDLKNTLSCRNGSADIHLLNKLQKVEITMTKKNCHISFLQECRRLNLIPTGLRLSHPYNNDKKVSNILRKTELKLMKEVIRILYGQIRSATDFKTCTLEIFKSKYMDLYQLTERLLSEEQRHTKYHLKAKHQKKLESLMVSNNDTNLYPNTFKLRTVENTITNLAEDNFQPSENEKILLSLGLNYAIPKPLDLNGSIDLMISIESTIKKAKLKCSEADEFHNGVARIVERNDTPKFIVNRMKWVRDAIQNIQKNKDIVILSADKGNSTVIMKKIDYEQKLLALLNTPDYTISQLDPIDETRKRLTKLIKSSTIRKIEAEEPNMSEEDKKKEQKEATKCWLSFNSHTPVIYGLPKLHKESMPLRPIVDFRGSLSYKLAKHVNHVLKHITKDWKYSTTNSADLITKLTDKTIPRGYEMVSFDVVSLFTRVPVEFTINYIKTRMLKSNIWEKRTPFKIEELIEIIQICTETTYFKFRTQIYKQESGLPMGSPLSPVVAEFAMQALEEVIVAHHPYIKFWIRYVDDIYAIVKTRKISSIHNELNNFHPAIQFTVEKEDSQNVWGDVRTGIAFLDLFLYRKQNDSIGHCVYRKPTHTNRYLHFTSCHPKAHKISVVDSLVTRALRVCDQEYIKKELDFIISTLQDNGYPKSFIEKRIKIQKHRIQERLQRKVSPTTEDTSTEDQKRAILPYYYGITDKIVTYIRRNTNLDIGYVPTNKISHHLCQYKDKKCIVEAGIYEWPCEGKNEEPCPKKYLGESRQGLDKRADQHLYHIRNGNVNDSAVAEHVLTTGHQVRKESIKFIEIEHNTIRRKVKEGLWIQFTPDTMNKNDGWRLNPNWTHILRKKFFSRKRSYTP